MTRLPHDSEQDRLDKLAQDAFNAWMDDNSEPNTDRERELYAAYQAAEDALQEYATNGRE